MAAPQPVIPLTMYYGYAAVLPAGGTTALIALGCMSTNFEVLSHRTYLFGYEKHRVQLVSQFERG
jgi:hypothetical protein